MKKITSNRIKSSCKPFKDFKICALKTNSYISLENMVPGIKTSIVEF